MAVNILTTDDLKQFKEDLFVELRQLLARQQKKDPPGHQREWLRTKEVCKMIGVSLSKLQYMRDNDEIKFTRIGGTIFYNTDEINKLLSSGYVNKNPN
jgi:excisionase family DNA binding protein